jgi:hypothetical protein
VVKRNQLVSLPVFAGTVLHERCHAASGAGDVTGEFEEALTKTLGNAASRQVKGRKLRAAVPGYHPGPQHDGYKP